MNNENTPFSPYNSDENFVNRPAIATGLPKTPEVAFKDIGTFGGNLPDADYMDVWKSALASNSKDLVNKREAIPLNSFSQSERYSRGTRPGDDWEEGYAQNQSTLSKGINGTLKGVNLAATTVAGGFAMLGGGLYSIGSGRLADIWDNPVMQAMDQWNQKVDQEYLPNFYTQKETEAEWYSTDNWLRANFLFDKLIKNSGYAVGAMFGGNIANTALLRGGSLLGKGLMSASNSTQAFKAFSPLLRSTARAFSAGKNAEAYTILQKEIKSIADVVERTSQMQKLAKTTNQFASFGDKARRTTVALYSSAGEASFEALHTSNDHREKLINDFITETGREPSGKDLDRINSEANQVGMISFLGNMALLSVTEYAQLPYLLGSSYKNTRNAATAMLGKADDVILRDSKYVTKGATTKVGKAFEKARGVGNFVFDPKEAGQELGQFALQVGVQNYFNKAKNNNDADLLVDGVLYGFYGVDETGEGVGALNSKEGIEGGILGGITGGLMQGISKFGQAKKQKAITSSFLNAVSSSPTISEAFQYKKDSINRGNELTKEQELQIINGNVLESKDLKADITFNYLSPRIKYGRTDLVMEELDDISQTASTPEGLAALKEQGIANINDTRETFLERVSELRSRAKSVEELYNAINLTYGAKSTTLPDGSKVRLYSEAMLDRMAYAASKIVDYDLRIPEVSASLIGRGILVQDIVDNELSGDTSISLVEALQNIENDSILTDPSILQRDLLDVVEMAKRRKKFVEEYKQFVNLPDQFNDDGTIKEQVNEQGQKKRTTVPINTDYFSMSRPKFKKDQRTYADLVNQYGEGVTSKRDVLKKISVSPHATILERRLAEMFLQYTPKDSKIILGDKSLPYAGVSETDFSGINAATSRINYEDNAFDYENGTLPVEHVMLHEIGHDFTTYGLVNDEKFRKDIEVLFEFVKDHFEKDPNKYSEAGLIKEGQYYAFKNVQEFVTEALSNREFQRYLGTIPYKNTEQSVWESFLDKLKKYFTTVFGIGDETVLTEVVAIVTNNIDKLYGSTKEQILKIEEEEEALSEATEALEEEQEDIEKQSGFTPTPPVEEFSSEELHDFEMKKDVSELFKSSTTESEDYADVTQSSEHIKNTREFFNKLKNFKNRDKLRAIIVTSNQLKHLGLEELIKLSYKITGSVDQIEGLNDVESGFVAQLYVIKEGKNYFYVDKDGTKLQKLGDNSVDISKVLFQTMPTTALYDSKGKPRFQAAQEDAAKLEAEAYKLYRAELFSLPPADFRVSKFYVSRGIAKRNPPINGKYEQNHVSGILVDENKISTQEGLIIIPKDGKIFFNQKTLSFPLGVPVLRDGDTLQYLQNTTFSAKKAENIYAVIKAMSDDIIEKAVNKRKITINRAYSKFLQSVLYWKHKGGTVSPNQIYVNPLTQKIHLGEKEYSFVDLEQSKNEIIEELQKAYFSVNEKVLTNDFYKPFYEFVVTDEGLTVNEWKNYQTFLLSSSYPKGKERGVESTPLITTVAKPTEAVPYSFKQKYATLEEIEFPYESVQTPAEEEVEEASTEKTFNDYILDGQTVNSFTVSAGELEFIGRISPEDKIEVRLLNLEDSDSTKELLEGLAENDQAMLKAILPALGREDSELVNMNEDERVHAVRQFFIIKVTKDLTALRDSQTGKPKPQKRAPRINPNFRKVGKQDSIERMTESDLSEFRNWMSKNLPQIPYEILERIITTEDGEKAWGVYVNGVAKFVKGGLKGTEYHEVFEAIWKNFLSKEEQQLLIEEFRTKSGTFTDRESGKKYNYDDPSVSINMIKERIADDFADFRLGKLSAKSLGQRILNFFKSILDFVKAFFNKPSIQESLFEAINAGKFVERVSNNEDTSTPEYRKLENLTATEAAEHVENMTFYIASEILGAGDKELLFNPKKITGDEIFAAVKEEYEYENIFDEIGQKDWQELVSRTKQKLKTLGITITTEDIVDLNLDDNNSRDYAPEPFTQDWKKTSSGAIKFMLATIPKRNQLNQSNKDEDTPLVLPDIKPSPNTGGFQLVNFGKVFSMLMDRLQNTTSLKEFESKLVSLAAMDSDFLAVFMRLGGSLETRQFDFDNFNLTDWKLFGQFYQTFTKQKPEALVQYIKNDNVYIGPANLYTDISQRKRSWEESMKDLSKDRKSIIYYDKNTKTYKIEEDAIKQFPLKTIQDKIVFLQALGIDFPIKAYKLLKTNGRGKNNSETEQFSKAVSSIHAYLGKNNDLLSLRSKTLNVDSHITKLAELYTRVTSPNLESTYFGVSGQRIGTYSDNNSLSQFASDFNESETLEELLEKRPELNDTFSKGSELLRLGGMFFREDGTKIPDKTLNVKYIQGVKDIESDTGTTISKLSLGDRFVAEINSNINGNYYALIAADGSTEWMMEMGNPISFESISQGSQGDKEIDNLFNRYLNDEIDLALDYARREKTLDIKGRGRSLRFFKDILDSKDVKAIEDILQSKTITDKKVQIDNYINDNRFSIKMAIQAYINNTVNKTVQTLIKTNKVIAKEAPGDTYTYTYPKLDSAFVSSNGLNKFDLTPQELANIIKFANVNYIISNTEYHKIIFGDPFQFKEKNGNLDETKRIKSFLSPRGRMFDTPQFNNTLNQTLNIVDGIQLKEEDFGYHEHKPYVNTATITDTLTVGSLANFLGAYGKNNETDGSSIVLDNTYREIKIKNNQWSEDAEAWHQWEMAYTRKALAKKGKYTYTNEKLKKYDAELTSKPRPYHKIEVLKPIVSGPKNNLDYISLVLDKFSQVPIYYSMVEGRAMENLYLKMNKENLGYVVVESGRKVGSEGNNSIYNPDGSFNENPYTNIIEIPWKSYGIQVETASSGQKFQTRGSQLTKLATVDLYENGEPVGTPEQKEKIKTLVNRNTELLDKLHQNAYQELLNKWGIVDNGSEFVMPDGKAISETLKDEMLRRMTSENVIDSLELTEDYQFIVPFEASNAYYQIRSILYSSINKSLISPKMHGGAHVQVAVTMFEQALKGRALAYKEGNTWTKIDKAKYDTLTEEQKKKVALTDDTLKFYEDVDGKRYCEIMLPAWFRNKFPKKMSDADILDYLNKTDEGQILNGIGFRIPTQSLSSAEVFKVKGFLPDYMGSTVIVPSEITTKSGSDFDIDKLNIYLKAVYVDSNKKVRMVKLFETEEATKKFYANIFDNTIKKEIDRVTRYAEFRNKLFDILNIIENIEGEIDLTDDMIENVLENEKDIDFYYTHRDMISQIFDQADARDMDATEYITAQITQLNKRKQDLSEKLLITKLKEDYVKDMYKKALENAYYSSLEELLTLPQNFKALVSPVDDGGLEDISKKLDTLRGYNEGSIKARMLDRNYLTNLRHAFVMGKKWIGIAAVNITTLSVRQKSQVFVDPLKIRNLSTKDKKYLGDGKMMLNHNTTKVGDKEVISLSGIYSNVPDKQGGFEKISQRYSGYATSFVDVAKNPYILKIIQSDLVVGVFMFLESVGAGTQGIMFLNQPIITEYINLLEANGSKSLFNKSLEEEILNYFPTKIDSKKVKVNLNNLEANISDYYSKNGLTDFQNAEQHRFLQEFLKYAKMSSFAFKFTQAINYDTTRFDSNDALTRKQWRTYNADQTNIISSASAVLNKTFIGRQASLIDASMEALTTVFKLDKEEFRRYTDSVLKKYAEDDFMSADKFDKIASKIRTSFLDYIIQTKLGINRDLKPLLIDPVKGIANNLRRLKRKYPEVDIIQDLEVVSGDRENSANTITLIGNSKDPIDENKNVDRMRELRDYNKELREFYEDLIIVSLFQGTYQTSISIKNVIPVEDYARLVTPVINELTPGTSLEAFATGMFQRNNYLDPLAAPIYKPFMKFTSEDAEPDSYDSKDVPKYSFENYDVFPSVPYLNAKSVSRQILAINENRSDYYLKNDYIKIPRILRTFVRRGSINEAHTIDLKWGESVTENDYAYRFAKGDTTLQDFYLYEKVYLPMLDENGNRIPLTTSNAKKEVIHIYKRINPMGDGARAGEWYTVPQKSVFRLEANQTQELNNDSLINYYSGEVLQDFKDRLSSSKETFERTTNIITREELRATPRVLYLFGDNDMRRGYGGQAREMRDEPNAVGISTKVSPNMDNSAFKTDDSLERNKEIITEDINKVIEAWDSGRYVKVVVPQLGEGLADLPNRAPLTWEFLNQELQRLQDYVSPGNLLSLPNQQPKSTNLIDLFNEIGITGEEWNSLTEEEQAQILKDRDLC